MVAQMGMSVLFYNTFGDDFKIYFKIYFIFILVFLILMTLFAPFIFSGKQEQPANTEETKEDKKNK